MSCPHSNFKAEVTVVNIGGGDFKVDVTVHCADCFKPLSFVGMPAGLFPEKPSVSLDGTEARLNAKLFS